MMRACAAAVLAGIVAGENRKIIIFVAPPCSGKGTQSPNIEQAYGIPHLSTGDMLRAAVAAKTPTGLQVKSLMDQGKLVDDGVVNKLVAERIQEPDCAKGFLLDGYPRNDAQATVLDEELAKTNDKVTDVVSIDVPVKGLMVCIEHRWMSPSGDSYNTAFIGGRRPKSLPKGAAPACDPNDLAHCNMKDDVTGEPLSRRSDDNLDTLWVRLKEYNDETAPVLTHYASVVKVVNGEQPEPGVWRDMHEALESDSERPAGVDGLASVADVNFSALQVMCVAALAAAFPLVALAISQRRSEESTYSMFVDV